MAEEAKESIYALLAEAQGEMGQPVKDQTATIKTKGGYTYTYKYSSLASIEAIVKPPLNSLGVFVGQRTVVHDLLGVCIQTYVACGETELVLDHEPYQLDRDPKENGSRTTYAKRYGMCKAFCLEGMEDGDIQGIDPQGNPMQPQYPQQEATKADSTAQSAQGGRSTRQRGKSPQNRPADPRKETYAHVAKLKMQAMELGAPESDIDAWYKTQFGDVAVNRLTDEQLQELVRFLGVLIDTCKQQAYENGGAE